MSLQIIFETHSTSEDNERGIASGWQHSRLSEKGRLQAFKLGERRRHDGIHALFTSDLTRAIETAEIAFANTAIPIFHDWRLRECNYGDLNGTSAKLHQEREKYLDVSYPAGESWRQAIKRIGDFLAELPMKWDGKRILIIGHRATHLGLEHFLNGVPLEELLVAEFAWQDGWEYLKE